MKVALDTNFPAYAEGLNDGGKQQPTLQRLHDIPRQTAARP